MLYSYWQEVEKVLTTVFGFPYVHPEVHKLKLVKNHRVGCSYALNTTGQAHADPKYTTYTLLKNLYILDQTASVQTHGAN